MEILLLALVVLYFLPTGLAIGNRKRAAGGIFIVNLFLGWLLIPWVLALAWAAVPDDKARA